MSQNVGNRKTCIVLNRSAVAARSPKHSCAIRSLFHLSHLSSSFTRTTDCHPETEYRSGAACPGKTIADLKIDCIARTAGGITDNPAHAALRARAQRNDAAIAV